LVSRDLVADHLDGFSKPTYANNAQWQCLDTLDFSWLYVAISPNLLSMVLKPKTTAHDIWIAIANLFHDNNPACSIQLEEQFLNFKKATSLSINTVRSSKNFLIQWQK
jgi:hypothetical protein